MIRMIQNMRQGLNEHQLLLTTKLQRPVLAPVTIGQRSKKGFRLPAHLKTPEDHGLQTLYAKDSVSSTDTGKIMTEETGR